MTATLTVPLGALVSWGPFTFVDRRSNMVSGLRLSAPTVRAGVPGRLLSIDRRARTVVPLEYAITWEYMMRGSVALGVAAVQAEFDALLAAWVAAPYHTLTVKVIGSSDVATGPARLEELNEVDGHPAHKRLHLSFFFEEGMIVG